VFEGIEELPITSIALKNPDDKPSGVNIHIGTNYILYFPAEGATFGAATSIAGSNKFKVTYVQKNGDEGY
jgi:hypothetical protein